MGGTREGDVGLLAVDQLGVLGGCRWWPVADGRALGGVGGSVAEIEVQRPLPGVEGDQAVGAAVDFIFQPMDN